MLVIVVIIDGTILARTRSRECLGAECERQHQRSSVEAVGQALPHGCRVLRETLHSRPPADRDSRPHHPAPHHRCARRCCQVFLAGSPGPRALPFAARMKPSRYCFAISRAFRSAVAALTKVLRLFFLSQRPRVAHVVLRPSSGSGWPGHVVRVQLKSPGPTVVGRAERVGSPIIDMLVSASRQGTHPVLRFPQNRTEQGACLP